MGILHGPNLVTDGLIFYVDVGNLRSYPGSGATWSDLSGNGTNVTLYNNAGLSGGHMDFDGVDDYALMTPVSAGTSWTFSIWVLCDNIPASSAWYDFYDEASGHRHTFACVGNPWRWMFYDTAARYSTFTLEDNNWHHFVATQVSTSYAMYVDGVAAGTGTSAGTQLGGDAAGISLYLPYLASSIIEEWHGFIDIMMIHNQTLTATEVLQNYDAHKGRFGL